MCGNKGFWELTAAFNESHIDGCDETTMCAKPPETSTDGLLILQPYNAIDHKGHIKGGEAVYYKYTGCPKNAP